MDLITGKLMSWVLPVDGDPAVAVQRECEWEIYDRVLAKGAIFSLKSGGVTGYESFSLSDDRGIDLRTLGRMGNPKAFWSACAGTKNSWLQQRVRHEDLMPAIMQWLQEQNTIVRVCMHCWTGLGVIQAEGGGGGWSHTICDNCVEE